jgi:hypothetical protein
MVPGRLFFVSIPAYYVPMSFAAYETEYIFTDSINFNHVDLMTRGRKSKYIQNVIQGNKYPSSAAIVIG